MSSKQIELLMRMAVEQARIALGTGDYPIGAALVIDDEIILARNERNTRKDKNSHAETNAIEIAGDKRDAKEKALFVTLEPCGMCARALMKFGIDRLYYILDDPVNGAAKSMYGISIEKVEYPEYLHLMAGWAEDHREKYPAHYEYIKRIVMDLPDSHA